MSLNFADSYGRNAPTSAAPANGVTGTRRDLPKAQTWLNVGVVRTVETTEGTQDVFVALPVGIPLDTMEPVQVRSANDFGKFSAARNSLMEQVQAEAAKLAPGEDIIINAGAGLAIQLRRVNDQVAQTAAEGDDNPYAVKLAFGG